MNGEKFRHKLEERNKDELKVLAKKLQITGYTNLNKEKLVNRIVNSDVNKLKKEISPSWWHRYYNHVYGITTILALVLSVAFYLIPFDNRDPYLQGTQRISSILESPVGFLNFASMDGLKREEVFNLHNSERVMWEGYISSFVGFDPRGLEFPFENDVGIKLIPVKASSSNLEAYFIFENVLPTDSGYELMSQLSFLNKNQKVRLSGVLDGTSTSPILSDAWIEAVFPLAG